MSLHNPGGTRVFVAEDDPAVLELIITRLEVAGYRTSSPKDGASALHIIKSSLLATVILDVNVPKLDCSDRHERSVLRCCAGAGGRVLNDAEA